MQAKRGCKHNPAPEPLHASTPSSPRPRHDTGPCDIAEPSLFSVVDKAKWEAWKACGAMSPLQARRMYVGKLAALSLPSTADVRAFHEAWEEWQATHPGEWRALLSSSTSHAATHRRSASLDSALARSVAGDDSELDTAAAAAAAAQSTTAAAASANGRDPQRGRRVSSSSDALIVPATDAPASPDSGSGSSTLSAAGPRAQGAPASRSRAPVANGFLRRDASTGGRRASSSFPLSLADAPPSSRHATPGPWSGSRASVSTNAQRALYPCASRTTDGTRAGSGLLPRALLLSRSHAHASLAQAAASFPSSPPQT